MNHEPITQKGMTNLCRTCLSSDASLTSLFSVLSLSGKEEPLNSILYKCTSIQVSNTDTFPHNICNSCLEKLVICFLYRDLCYDSHLKLQQLFNAQKELVPNINSNAAVNEACGAIKNDYEAVVDQGTSSSNHKPLEIQEDLLGTSKSGLQRGETNLDKVCDFQYLGCDNHDSYDEFDKEKNVEFSCSICRKRYCSKYSLNRHFKVHLDPGELKCHVCMKRFTRITDVKRHLTVHTGEKPFECDICKCSFTQSGSLATHLRQKHKTENSKAEKKLESPAKSRQEKPYLCSTCGKCFRHNSTLKMHLRRHLGERPFACHICNYRFVSSGRLQSHMRVHTGERPFVCQICNKTFAQSTVLARHLKAHANIKPHKCSYCSKRFFAPYYLNIHLRLHTGEKPLKCSTCFKMFACPKTLRQHSKVHLEEKPYLCMDCGKSFRRSQHLQTHVKLHGKIQQVLK